MSGWRATSTGWRLLRSAAGLGVALLVGFLVLAPVMSDLGPGETGGQRIGWVVALGAGGGLVVGLLAGGAWPLAALCGWPLLLRALLDLQRLAEGGAGDLGESALPGLGVTALALLAGRLGAWLGARRPRA